MRRSSLGFPMAWAAALVLAFSGARPARADLITSEPEAGTVAAAPPDGAGTSPEAVSYADAPMPAEGARVGYALTWDEFAGGILCLAAAGVATYFLVINHPGDF